MIDPSAFLLFLAASVALILVPGPAQAMVLAHTLAGGRRAGTLTAIGLNVGTLFHAALAAFGLSAILATSALAFAIVKYAGAAYLLYLGVQALRARETRQDAAPHGEAPSKSPLVQAIVTGILNPKVAIFFLAFLPQFVDASRGSVFAQFMVLGATIAVLDTLYEVALVHLAAGLRDRLRRNPRLVLWQARASGAVLVALGLRLALQER